MNFWLSFEENQPLWKVQWNICGPFRLQDQIIHCSVQAMIHVYWQLLWHFPLFENENEEKLVQIISDDFQVYSFSESISYLTICTITGLAIRDGNLSMNRQDKKIVSARGQEATSFPLEKLPHSPEKNQYVIKILIFFWKLPNRLYLTISQYYC